METRSIIHLGLDNFLVAVERRKDQRLTGRPLIIGGNGDRSVVAACSEEARSMGIYPGMAGRLARQLCPQGTFVRGDFDAYTAEAAVTSEMLQVAAPVCEQAALHRFYLDLTGMERFYGAYRWASELRARIVQEQGLPLSLGCSVNKLVSRVAGYSAGPNGSRQVAAPEVAGFLAPLPVARLPRVDVPTARRLAYLGVRDIHTLRQIPRPALIRVFDRQGSWLYRSARGEDDRLVSPARQRDRLRRETAFEPDSIDLRALQAALLRMCEELAYELRQQGKLTAQLTLKLRYAQGETVSRQMRLPHTQQDEVLIAQASQLFSQLYTRRIRVRLLGLQLGQLVHSGAQLQLFSSPPRQIQLYQSLDHIRDKYGTDSIFRAGSRL